VKENEMLTILAIAAIALVIAIALWPRTAHAHCDTEDGPAVAAGRLALETANPASALAWIHEEGESEVRDVFERALRVRALGGEAALLADRLFLETLVRVHRAGEGAGFEGIKPAGTVDPVVAAADRALEVGTLAPLAGLVPAERLPELEQRLEAALAASDHHAGDVAAGRRRVAAYVSFVKYAEGEAHGKAGACEGADPHGPSDEALADHAHERRVEIVPAAGGHGHRG
jgi:hypothetical protein